MTLPNLKAITASALLLLPLALQAEPAKFVVDEEHFSMRFEIMHVGYAPVMGMFRDVEGQFEYDEQTGDNTGTVTGDLTLLGQTRPVDIDVTLNKAAEYPFGHEEYTLGISAETAIKRSDWGMTYGVDNGMVGDEVTLRFGFEAIKEGGWF